MGVNIVSQLVNWTITIAYFATPVAKTMASSILVESYKNNVHEQIQQDLLFLKEAVTQDVRDHGGLSKRAETMVRKVEWEIKMMKNVAVKLDGFLPQETFQIRRVLLQQWADEFSMC